MYEFILWISVTAYALHLFEEEGSEGLKGVHRFTAHTSVLIFGISAAMVGWRFPAFSLAFPALLILNGIFFHTLPTIVSRRFIPGLITTLLLFFPISLWAFWGASEDNVLSPAALILAFLIAGVIMASPLLFMKVKWTKR